MKIGQFGDGSADDVDWAMAHKAFKLVSHGKKREVVKHSSGFCGTNKNMKCWKKWESDACPLCGQPAEDAWHVTMCPDPWVQEQFEQSIAKVREFLCTLQTEPHIANTICEWLLAWQQGLEFAPAMGSFFGLAATVHLQDKLGWWAFIEGAPCKGWAETQQGYYIVHRQQMDRSMMAVSSDQEDVGYIMGYVGELQWNFAQSG